jgi:glycosyltransferase involved in cell wall biosynthesis
MDETRSPRISIVTPSFNQAAYLTETLQSVSEQDYPNIEHIVIDGGSTDGSVEIIESWARDHEIRWSTGPDGGQADAIQRGVEIATGSIVAWLNSDDVYLGRHAVSTVAELFGHGAKMVTAGGWFLDPSGERTRRIRVRAERLDNRTLRHVDWVLQPATFVRRDLFLEVPIDISLRYAFDWDFFVRLTQLAEFTVLEEDIAGYRLHRAGKTLSGALQRQIELLEVTRRYHKRSSIQYAFMLAVTWTYRAAARLPGPLDTFVAHLLTYFARGTQELMGGRGIPS